MTVQDEGLSKKFRGGPTTDYQPQDDHSNLIFMWSSKIGGSEEPAFDLIQYFADALDFVHDKKQLAVTFPTFLENMTAESKGHWEIRMSNIVQKCQIFYQHNTVTEHDTEDRSKPAKARGKVLIIANHQIKNKLELEHQTEEDKIKSLK